MSFLGDYVHYSWKNYRLFGTHRKLDVDIPNFNPMIFTLHRDEIYSNIISMHNIQNIKKLEEQYNDGAELFNNFLKQVINHKNEKNNQSFLKELLLAIDKGWKSIADNIIKGLEWDDELQAIIYNPKYVDAITNEAKNETKSLMGEITRKSGIHIDVLKKHLKFIENKIDNLVPEGALKNSLKAECNQFYKLLNFESEAEKKLEIPLKKITTGTHRGGFISVAQSIKIENKDLVSVLLDKINSITARTITAAQIQKEIGADIAEFMGTVVSNRINNLTKKTIKEEFRKLITELGGKTAGSNLTKKWIKNGIGSVQLYPELDESSLENLFNSKKYEESVKRSKNLNQYGEYSYWIKTFQGSDSVQQKADFTVQLNTNFPEVLGVSMKNYDMRKLETEIENSQIPSSIHLQSGDLGFWLAAIETQHQNLGTHYLQIFSKQRGYASGKYSTEIKNMRQQANEAFVLFLLWSAATGRGQGRGEEGQFADILAIYDKAKNTNGLRRLRLYSFRELILEIYEDKKLLATVMHPPFEADKAILGNDYIGSEPSQEKASERITKLLAEARNYNISVSLSKAYLNSFVHMEK